MGAAGQKRGSTGTHVEVNHGRVRDAETERTSQEGGGQAWRCVGWGACWRWASDDDEQGSNQCE